VARTASRAADRTRKLAFLVLILAVLGAFSWFLARNLEWKDERTWVGYHGEAETNDFLAAQRLLSRLGRDAHSIQGLPVMKTLGARDALILPRRQLRFTPGQVKELLGWVEKGGLLIAEGTFAEDPGSDRVNDPLFKALGVRMVRNGLKAPAYQKDEDFKDYDKRKADFEREHGVEEITINDLPCRVDLGAYDQLQDLDGSNGQSKLRGIQRGKGYCFLFTHLTALDNRDLDREDHADFLAALVSHRPPEAKVWIVYQEQPPSLMAWLKANAWMVLAASGALTLIALWRGLRRLGPPLPDPPLDRRSLLEHLAAAGRFQWRVRDGEALLAAAQEALKERLWRSHPALAAMPPEEQMAALADRSGLSEARIFKAMRYGRHAEARDFTEAIQTLELLRNLP
jgi:hypothetical protein